MIPLEDLDNPMYVPDVPAAQFMRGIKLYADYKSDMADAGAVWAQSSGSLDFFRKFCNLPPDSDDPPLQFVPRKAQSPVRFVPPSPSPRFKPLSSYAKSGYSPESASAFGSRTIARLARRLKRSPSPSSSSFVLPVEKLHGILKSPAHGHY